MNHIEQRLVFGDASVRRLRWRFEDKFRILGYQLDKLNDEFRKLDYRGETEQRILVTGLPTQKSSTASTVP